MSKSEKAKVYDLLAKEFHQLREQKIHTICAAIEAVVYWAEKVPTTKCRQFQVHLNRFQQAATTWSDADRQKAIDRLECKIHWVTPVKHKSFKNLFQDYEWQLLQDVRTNATGSRRIFAQQLALRKAATAHKTYGAANMTADMRLQFQIHLSDTQTDATTRSLAGMELVTNQLEREIHGITWNE